MSANFTDATLVSEDTDEDDEDDESYLVRFRLWRCFITFVCFPPPS